MLNPSVSLPNYQQTLPTSKYIWSLATSFLSITATLIQATKHLLRGSVNSLLLPLPASTLAHAPFSLLHTLARVIPCKH